jgi:tetratricopeptide (TPR) repeat protein
VNAEVEKLFESAVVLPPEQRAAFLFEHCTDPHLRHEVELLLEHDRGAETFLREAVSGVAASLRGSATLRASQTVGVYEILSLVGRGGMGAVYRARRADGKFEQNVAIKVMHDGLGSSFGSDRLQQEYRILAALEHPNIAGLLDAGITEGGIPYFVMEYVDGVAIDTFCADQGLSVPQRLRLFLSVCDAVQSAHQKLVVHRDLKPENILVTESGVPKLLDFGIAKVLSESSAGLSQTMTRAMTPEYASPEQVRGEPISTATDIYSLGCVLYKLLTGVSPQPLKGCSSAEAVQIICDREMPDPRAFTEIPPDAVHILRMALRKEPQRRYRSVDQFAGDIQRLLNGRPLLAGPDTWWYRCAKFVRRNWVAVTAITTVLLALGAGAGIATWQARRAERRFGDVRHLANVFLFDFENSIHDVPGTTRARQLVVNTALEYLQKLSQDASRDPALAREVATAYEKVGDIQGGGMANVGNTAGAVRSYEQAIQLRRTLGDPESSAPAVRVDFGNVLVKLAAAQARTNDLNAAIRNCRDVINLSDVLLKSDPASVPATKLMASAYLQLPFLLHRRSDVQGAVESAQKGLALRQKLAEASPQDKVVQQELAYAYFISGELQARLRNNIAAIAGFTEVVELDRRLLAATPDDHVARRQLMIGLSRLGFLQFAEAKNNKSKAEGIANAREAFMIAEQKASADPDNAEALSDLMANAVGLGQILGAFGRQDEARVLLERAVAAATGLVQHDPDNRENRLNLALSHGNLARFLLEHKDPAGALRQRQMANDLLRELARQWPNDAKILYPFAFNLYLQGATLSKLGQWEGAQRTYLEGLKIAEEMDPKNPTFDELLGALRNSVREADKHLKKH